MHLVVESASFLDTEQTDLLIAYLTKTLTFILIKFVSMLKTLGPFVTVF